VLQRTRDLRTETIDSLTKEMVREGTRQITRDDPSSGSGIRVLRTADLRYAGQSHELTLPVGPRLAQRFHRLHKRAYGYARRGDEMELVTLRVRVEGPVPKLDWRRMFGATRPSGVAANRRLWDRFSTPGSVRCLPRASLPRRASLAGPFLVEEYSATTYVADGFELRVGDLGELVIDDRAGTKR
jgi:N-methylhydantoinase A